MGGRKGAFHLETGGVIRGGEHKRKEGAILVALRGI